MSRKNGMLGSALAVLASGLLLAACGGGGDKDGCCVFTLRTDGAIALCEDGYSSGECSSAQDNNYSSSFSEGSTCSALGYTLACAGDPPGMFRKTCP